MPRDDRLKEVRLDLCLTITRKKRLRQLDNLLNAIFVKNFELHNIRLKYYQGFHDVVSVFLLTLDCNLGYYCADTFARFYLVDYCQLSFDQGLIPLFKLTTQVLKVIKPDLWKFLTLDGEQPTMMFMTSWMLTLFSHDIKCLENVRRMFDLYLVEHPLIIVYICVSLIVDR